MSARRKRKEKGRVQNQKIQKKRLVPEDDLHQISCNNIKQKLEGRKLSLTQMK